MKLLKALLYAILLLLAIAGISTLLIFGTTFGFMNHPIVTTIAIIVICVTGLTYALYSNMKD